MRSFVKRILVTCAATTALALLLTMVLCALGNAMAPKWQVEPFTDHITLTTTNTAIQAVDPATGAVLKTPQEGAYRTKETHITVALDGGKTVNAIVRELDLTRLDRGSYQLDVVIRTASTVLVTRSTPLLLK